MPCHAVQVEGSFSQPNAAVCCHMLSWAQRVTAPPSGTTPSTDLLELYCGNGNFTIPLAQNFRCAALAPAVFVRIDELRIGRTQYAQVLVLYQAGYGSSCAVATCLHLSDTLSYYCVVHAKLMCAAIIVMCHVLTFIHLTLSYTNGHSLLGIASHCTQQISYNIIIICSDVVYCLCHRRVVATEVSKASVEAAKYNISANKVENIFIARWAAIRCLPSGAPC